MAVADDGEVEVNVGSDGEGSDGEAEDMEALKVEADGVAKRVAKKLFGDTTVVTIDHLAEGGYNHVWRAICNIKSQETAPAKFILRIRRKTPSLQPYQVRNQVACLQWLASNARSIPVPKLYDWDDGVSGAGPAFTAEEFINGQRLSVVWPELHEEEKTEICKQIADVVADLGETRFQSIGSLTPSTADGPIVGPTVEAAKVFNGRTKFHSPECYDIGPYANSKDYILACYDREIYFYTHADQEDIEDFFDNTTTSVSGFVDQLKRQRQDLSTQNDPFTEFDAEPLVLVHEDFHAGNMLVRDGKLMAVLDWEFSGVYPLSQLLGKAQVLQISMPFEDRSEATEKEEDEWHERYRRGVGDVVRRRGWAEREIETLLGDGHEILNAARMIMFPMPE